MIHNVPFLEGIKCLSESKKSEVASIYYYNALFVWINGIFLRILQKVWESTFNCRLKGSGKLQIVGFLYLFSVGIL